MLIREVDRHRLTDNRLLVDFGCGNGSWLELFRACNVSWDLCGTEIGAGNVEHIKRLGFSWLLLRRDHHRRVLPAGNRRA